MLYHPNDDGDLFRVVNVVFVHRECLGNVSLNCLAINEKIMLLDSV